MGGHILRGPRLLPGWVTCQRWGSRVTQLLPILGPLLWVPGPGPLEQAGRIVMEGLAAVVTRTRRQGAGGRLWEEEEAAVAGEESLSLRPHGPGLLVTQLPWAKLGRVWREGQEGPSHEK